MSATVRPLSWLNPAAAFPRDTAIPPPPRPANDGAARTGALSESDLLAELEPHWAAAIDAATD